MSIKADNWERNRWTLVGIEMLLVSICIPIWLCKRFDWDLFTGIISGVLIMITLAFLFFGVRVFRYLFSVLFSLAWGLLAYMFADKASQPPVTPWVTLAAVMVIALALHKDYFNFERGIL